jgi:5-methylcytosine-specific restriction endonuclease McrA
MTKNGRIRIRNILWLKQGGLCCYCEKPMVRADEDRQVAANQFGISCDEVEQRRATFEHLVRQCEGGTDALDNLALAHGVCNNKRKHLDWLTYKSQVMGEWENAA